MKKEWKRFLSLVLSTVMVLTAVPTGTGQLEARAGEPEQQGGVSENGGSENETPATLSGNGTSEDPYIIANDEDWTLFAGYVADENDTYDGKYYKLGSDIHITEPVGSETQPFEGVFDGDGNTLDVTIEDTTQKGTAPFRFIKDAAIKNLKATGSVTGTLHAAGLVGFAQRGSEKNTFSDCYVAVNVTAIVPYENKTHIGGVVGHGTDSKMVFENIVYSGELKNDHSYAGGILGWCTTGSITDITLNNCLYIGSYTGTEGWIGPIALKGDNSSLPNVTIDDNLYYAMDDVSRVIHDDYNEVWNPVFL